MVLDERQWSLSLCDSSLNVNVVLLNFSNQPLLLITDMNRMSSIVSVERTNITDDPLNTTSLSTTELDTTVLLGPHDVKINAAVKKIAICFFKNYPCMKLLISLSVRKLNSEILTELLSQLDNILRT